jgi:hypothetical protein
MSNVAITLTNGVNDYTLLFDLLNTNIANKWFLEIDKNYPLFEDWRFTGWPDSNWTADTYIQAINECVEIVNRYQPNTIPVADVTTDLNYLHKFFETLRGSVLTPTAWYTSAPSSVQEAVSKFNVYIHNYEKLLNSRHLSPTITCTFNCTRVELGEEDYQHFTYDWKFGTIYINYCEVGKHLLELFTDHDDIVGKHNIRPAQYYSADFKLKFFTNKSRKEFKKFDQRVKTWATDNDDFFKQLGIKQLALGFIPVATLNLQASGFNNLTQVEIIDKLKNFNKVKSVRTIDSQ